MREHTCPNRSLADLEIARHQRVGGDARRLGHRIYKHRFLRHLRATQSQPLCWTDRAMGEAAAPLSADTKTEGVCVGQALAPPRITIEKHCTLGDEVNNISLQYVRPFALMNYASSELSWVFRLRARRAR